MNAAERSNMVGYGWVEIIGFISGALGIIVVIPQLVKILKHNRNEGVSFGMWFFTMTAQASWMSYSIKVNSFSQIIVNLIAALLALVLLSVMLKQNNQLTLGRMLLVTLFPTGFGIIVFNIDLILISIILIVFSSARILQIRKSWLSLKNNIKSEVAISAHALSGTSALGWTVYGLITGLWVNVILGILIAIYCAIIVVIEFAVQKRYVS